MKDNNPDNDPSVTDRSVNDDAYETADCNPKFKIILFIFITLILYVFITESVDTLVQITLLVILYFLLFVDHCNDNEGSCVFDPENTEGFDSYKNREERIKDLNDTRGKLGNFYVNCHSCGRKRILEERHKIQQDILRSCQSYRTPCTGRGCASGCKGTCTGSCKEREHETMSFFNNKYVDKDQIFCYNCLMDNVHNDRYFTKNYVYWPTIRDPVNGPPYD